MNIHNLINLDNKKCLYCSSECKVKSAAYYILSEDMYTDEFNCDFCNEIFIVTYNSLAHVMQETFTCKSILVKWSSLNEHFFSLLKRNDLEINNSFFDIPKFNIDMKLFKNKESLFKKLSTYLVFS
jgi:hypothetical protein